MNRHMRVGRVAVAVAAMGLLAACGTSGTSSAGSSSSGSSSGGSTAGTMIGTANTSLGTVLTGANGFTLYMFSPDTSTSSACTGACATLWPPATGTGTPASGTTLPGKLGTIMRPDGTTQVEYNGHPAYTYTHDSAPGQTNGEGVLNQWHVIKTTSPVAAGASTSGGASAPATTAPATGGGVGGY